MSLVSKAGKTLYLQSVNLLATTSNLSALMLHMLYIYPYTTYFYFLIRTKAGIRVYSFTTIRVYVKEPVLISSPSTITIYMFILGSS